MASFTEAEKLWLRDAEMKFHHWEALKFHFSILQIANWKMKDANRLLKTHFLTELFWTGSGLRCINLHKHKDFHVLKTSGRSGPKNGDVIQTLFRKYKILFKAEKHFSQLEWIRFYIHLQTLCFKYPFVWFYCLIYPDLMQVTRNTPYLGINPFIQIF